MPRKTTNHEYSNPKLGESDWAKTLQSFIDAIDEDVIIVDDDANKNNYVPVTNSILIDKNTGATYIGDGNNWNQIPQTGKTPSFNAVLYNEEDLTTRSPSGGEVAFHDGTGTPSTSLCFETGGNWYNIVDGNTF